MPEIPPACPLPISSHPRVLLGHGSGGRLSHQLLESLLLPAFGNPALLTRHDGAVLGVGTARIALSTDSFVVRPLFFPGGDIGTLAVNGTINDLAMCGARPLALSVALVLEEGLAMETLWKVVSSMRDAAAAVGVPIVTGDTKVVERGKGDGLYVNTTGLGAVEAGVDISPAAVRPGDAVLLSGDIARHGMAVMSVREGLEFASQIESDCAALWDPVRRLLEAKLGVHCLRDLTRGGLASAAIEIAEAAGLEIELDEPAVAVREDVRGACEVLGLDPMYVASEGRFIAVVAAQGRERAAELLGARVIGSVRQGRPGLVSMRTALGAARVLDMLTGDQLPRIC